MTRTKILLLWLTFFTLSAAETTRDQDMDGVPDKVDQCKNTPFLDEVNEKGCPTNKLTSLGEKNNDSFNANFGYGFENNEDTLNRDTQYASKLQFIYYHDDWSYSLQTGYFKMDSSSGQEDTTVKIKRKFKLSRVLKLGLGLGVRLATYDFIGNKTDYVLHSSLAYYPISSVSLFAGASYTFINDREDITPLQDINSFYLGSGYFFTKDFYANIAYSYIESKFTTKHAANSFMTTLFYRLNKKCFTTLSYSHEIDEDLHNALSIKFGYSIW